MPKKNITKDKPAKTKKTVKSSQSSYVQVVGRRRRATARVRLYPFQKGEIEVNGQPIEQYFPGKIYKTIYQAPLRTCNAIDKYKITIKVMGSGVLGQLGAVVHGLARVLEKIDLEKFRPILKKRGFLARDPRKKERHKVGMGGKARRKKQSPKR
jgi:small subunit ribosomal protein S9